MEGEYKEKRSAEFVPDKDVLLKISSARALQRVWLEVLLLDMIKFGVLDRRKRDEGFVGTRRRRFVTCCSKA